MVYITDFLRICGRVHQKRLPNGIGRKSQFCMFDYYALLERKIEFRLWFSGGSSAFPLIFLNQILKKRILTRDMTQKEQFWICIIFLDKMV